MIYLYTLLFYLLLPFILLRLVWRARKAPAYLKRWSERFGFVQHLPKLSQSIWVHAVSLGEVLAATPLVKALQQQYPDKAIIVTTLTPTGSERVEAIFNNSVYHVYAPYDLPALISRFLKRVNPALLIIIETEIWPNIIHQCTQRQIPIIIANGRLSAQSARGYARFRALTAATLRQVTQLAAQTPAEAERFIELGLPAERITITGNIKFDIEIPTALAEKAIALKQQWGSNRPVWIAASTHDGEEEQILTAFKTVKHQFPQLLLVLVPRHPERFNPVATLCQRQGFIITRRSENTSATTATEIYLGDTLGELLMLYQAADLAFVGGSLIPVGGHNLLEPAAIGIPSLTGPHLFNFLEISRLLQAAGAMFPVSDSQSIANQVSVLLTAPQERILAGQRGQTVVAANRGSLQAHLGLISSTMTEKMS